jgi:ABC-type transport system involved in multi-copper enzyme maturation permease subunit
MTTTVNPPTAAAMPAVRDASIDARLDAIERKTAHIEEVIDSYFDGTRRVADRTRPDRAPQPVTAIGVLRSEWVKLRSLRSSTMTLLGSGAALLVIGAIAAAVSGGLLATPDDDGDGFGAGDPTSIAMSGILLAPLIIGVLGVLLITGEYATGTIRTTMTLVPKRLPVLWAKVAVLTAVTVPVMVLAALTTFWTGQLILDAGGAGTASLGDPGVLRAVLGTAGYLAGVALLGLASGTLLRGTAQAISVLVSLIFLLPGLGALLLPVDWQDNVLRYLPSNAASSFTTVAPGPELLSAGTGALVFAAWVVVPVLLAAVALRRRPV